MQEVETLANKIFCRRMSLPSYSAWESLDLERYKRDQVLVASCIINDWFLFCMMCVENEEYKQLFFGRTLMEWALIGNVHSPINTFTRQRERLLVHLKISTEFDARRLRYAMRHMVRNYTTSRLEQRLSKTANELFLMAAHGDKEQIMFPGVSYAYFVNQFPERFVTERHRGEYWKMFFLRSLFCRDLFLHIGRFVC